MSLWLLARLIIVRVVVLVLLLVLAISRKHIHVIADLGFDSSLHHLPFCSSFRVLWMGVRMTNYYSPTARIRRYANLAHQCLLDAAVRWKVSISEDQHLSANWYASLHTSFKRGMPGTSSATCGFHADERTQFQARA